LSVVADLLNGKTLDWQAIARLVGVKRAAAERLLRAIAMTLPVEARKVRGRRAVTLKQGTHQKAPSTTTAVAACIGASVAPLFAGSAYEGGLLEAARYLAKATNRSDRLEHLERKFFFVDRGGDAALPQASGVLDEIVDAVLEEQPIAFQYSDFAGKTTRERVHALSLAIYDHQIYLLGRKATGKLRLYRLGRIKNPVRGGRRFDYPSKAEFDPRRVFRDSFGIFLPQEGGRPEEVVIRLDPRWRVHANTHRWHPTQQVNFSARHVTVRLQVCVCPEVEMWILGFGDEAEVLAPEHLRQRISLKVSAAARQYEPASQKLDAPPQTAKISAP
jgi:predicted DNA-binding transcriptional regulator YafY